MKRILCIISTVCLLNATQAQRTDRGYAQAWRRVTSFEQANLPASAAEEVGRILRKARQGGDLDQELKAIFQLGTYLHAREEDALPRFVDTLTAALKTAQEARRALLHSLRAAALMEYLAEQRGRLYGRSQTLERSEDIRTWSATDLHQAISEDHLAALVNPEALKRIPAGQMPAAIAAGTLRNRRPTLYDLIVHAALDYFTRDERDITRFSGGFEVKDPRAFAPAAVFSTLSFVTTDSLSLDVKALRLFQEALAWHLNDRDPSALVDLDIRRLTFVHDRSVDNDRDARYGQALTELATRYQQSPAAAQAFYLKAALHLKKASDGAGIAGRDREALQRIEEDCLRIISRHPGSEGALNAAILQESLRKRELSMQVEQMNIPGQDFRCRVAYRNLTDFHYRILPITDSLSDILSGLQGDEYWKKLRTIPAITSKTQALPVFNDLRSHAVEIRIAGLPAGQYLILASPEKDFPMERQPMAAIAFQMTRIAWINRGNDYFILDREHGQPLTDARVHIWQTSFGHRERKPLLRLTDSARTDLNGYFRMPPPDMHTWGSYRLEVDWQGERVFPASRDHAEQSDDRTWYSDRETYENRYRRLHLFTDRSIYRPGQTVHFKGIFVTRDPDTHRPTLVTGRQTMLKLMNANGEETDSVTLHTSEYGSLQGSFRLPERGLTGTFRIAERDYGTITFQVEEYKRPTFEVTWDKPPAAYSVYDSVSVIGRAQTYAGAALNGARVSYRVQRVPRYPFPWRWHQYGWSEPSSTAMEIAHGSALTDAEGCFPVRFPALPDRTIDSSLLPQFDFHISADVTDINGETRTGEEVVAVGYHTLNLGIDLGTSGTLTNNIDLWVELTATNLSGVPRQVNASLELLPLDAPKRLIRPRFWAAPDTFAMSETEYIRYFPLDEYARELQSATWSTRPAVFQHRDSLVGGSARVKMPLKGLPAGWYRILLTATDTLGKPVRTRHDLHVTDARTGLGGPAWLAIQRSHPSAQPGDRVSLTLASSDSILHVIQLLDGYQGDGSPEPAGTGRNIPQRLALTRGPGTPYRFIQLGTEPLHYELPITEADKGGFGISHAFVRHNRMHVFEELMPVPWSDKELDIRVETWRDRTLPGSSEEWTVNVRGSKGQRVAAEMLLSMYDASLDQFRGHEWRKPDLFEVYPSRFDRYLQKRWSSHHFRMSDGRSREYQQKPLQAFNGRYDRFIWADGLNTERLRFKDLTAEGGLSMKLMRMAPGMVAADAPPPGEANQEELAGQVPLNETVVAGYGNPAKKEPAFPMQVRKDFRETAFFLPDLRTDSLGNIRFRFTMPEALTRWKWQMLAHTKDLSMATAARTIVTQKALMVQANAPRFLREGDQLSLPAKVSNLTGEEITGQLTLEIIDAETGNSVDGYFHNVFPVQYFTAAARQSTAVLFTLKVPGNYSRPVGFRLTARSPNHSDGEERMVPVLTDRILVTESMPLRLQGVGTKIFQFPKLMQSDAASSLTHHRLTVEWSTNPSWYAVESLPYLTTFPYDCAEQSFNKFYANALARHIVTASPAIRAWQARREADTAGRRPTDRLTPLARNPELKDILVEETPWVFDARDEDRQRRDIRTLFDIPRLSQDLDFSLSRVAAAQSPNGGFVWFHGGPEDRYMTQYILTGFARLYSANAVPVGYEEKIRSIVDNGIGYLQKRLREDLEELKRQKADMSGDHAGDLQIQGLFTLSGFPERGINEETRTAYETFRRMAAQWWTRKSPQLQAMTALMLHRSGDVKIAKAILRSLKEYAVRDSILGMYWKYDGFRGYWSDATIETQSMLIVAFSEIDGQDPDIDRMREWLLTQKQTNRWGSTRATADACHALLLSGTDWLAADRSTEVRLGISTPRHFNSTADNGIGYLKGVVDGERVKADMGNIGVTVAGNNKKENGGIGWGAVHWQYFEHMDRITSAPSPLSLGKSFYIERKTERGPRLEPLTEDDDVQVGDKLIVRLELRNDRDLEYVHLKDLRASGSEPVNVISGYHWRGGLGYYESTRDAATNFFFQQLPKGTHVFEYPLFISHAGKFSAGIATVECMYAPEFRGHTEGRIIRVR